MSKSIFELPDDHVPQATGSEPAVTAVPKTADELRQFFLRNKGRSPQDVLGTTSSGRLTYCIAWATIGAAAVLVAGTLLPWWLIGPTADTKQHAKPVAANQTAAAHNKDAAGPAAARPAATAPASSGQLTATPKPSDADKAVKVMGLGETKTADPKTNPMDKDLDNLLDKRD